MTTQIANLVERYAQHHLPAPDCRLASARNTLAYGGFRESYAVIAGLASCFGFVYRKAPFDFREEIEMPSCDLSAFLYPILGTRVGALENLAYVTGGTLHGSAGGDGESTLARIREFVCHGIPVMATISPRALARHTGRSLDIPDFLKPVDFGTEWVTVAEIDDGADTVTMFHAMSRRPVIMTLEEFQQARCDGDDSPEVLVKSRNRWAVLLVHGTPDRRDIFHAALAKTHYHLSNLNGRDQVCMGVRGVEALASELPRWCVNENFSASKLRATVWMMHVQSEILSSGGMGRRLYSNFLQQASEVFASDALLNASNFYRDVAVQWREVIGSLMACVLGENVTDLTTCAGLSEPLLRIAELEYRAAGELEDFVRGRRA